MLFEKFTNRNVKENDFKTGTMNTFQQYIKLVFFIFLILQVYTCSEAKQEIPVDNLEGKASEAQFTDIK